MKARQSNQSFRTFPETALSVGGYAESLREWLFCKKIRPGGRR
jgi:hypothetical protein